MERICTSYIEDASGGAIISPIDKAQNPGRKQGKKKPAAIPHTEETQAKEPKKIGRPRIPDEVFQKILALIEDGYSVAAICQMEGMPTFDTVWRRINADPSFSDSYSRARERRADRYLEEISSIADNATDDVAEIMTKKGEISAVNRQAIERAKLMIATRQWVMAKLNPKKYSESAKVEHSGKIEIPGISVVIESGDGGNRG